MPAVDLLSAYRARRLSPVEVARAVLDRIEKFDSQINAFIIVTADEALAAARASEERWRRDAPAGLVDGVPTSVKDVILMKGNPTRPGGPRRPKQPEGDDGP